VPNVIQRGRRPRGPNGYRPLPHDLDSERQLLGAQLLGGLAVVDRVTPICGPRDYYAPHHVAIAEAVIALARAGAPVEHATVANHLRSSDRAHVLVPHGGEAYLTELILGVVTEYVEWHAKRVAGWARVRRAAELHQGIAQSAAEAASPEEWLETTRQAIRESDELTPPPAKTLPTLRLSAIPEPGPVTWLVEKLWTAGAFGIVGALPKSWKSFLTLHVGICVAAGRPVLGRFRTQQGRVLVFSAEGGKRAVRRRAGAMCRALQLDLDGLDLDILDLPLLRLDNPATAAAFIATVEAIRPALVILDPLRELHGGDENDSAYVATLLGPLRTLQERVGAAVMVIHHNVKPAQGAGAKRRAAELLRGSGALAGAIDSGLFLEPDGEGEDKRVTVSALHRDAPEPESFKIRLRVQAIDAGEAIWLEVVNEEEGESEDRAAAAREKALRTVLRAITNAAMPGRTPLRGQRAIAEVCRMRPKTVNEAVRELTESRRIEKGGNGAYRPLEGAADA
jgi:hypothetical protein